METGNFIGSGENGTRQRIFCSIWRADTRNILRSWNSGNRKLYRERRKRKQATYMLQYWREETGNILRSWNSGNRKLYRERRKRNQATYILQYWESGYKKHSYLYGKNLIKDAKRAERQATFRRIGMP